MDILHTAIEVNGVRLPNRLVMPPMATHLAGAQGEVTDEDVAYYDEKSRGGYIGLIITEHMFVSPEGRASEGQISAADDGDVDGLARLAAAVHANGTKIFAQINHAGGAADPADPNTTLLSASVGLLPNPRRRAAFAEEMTAGDIRRITEAFAQAAARVKRAGFDGVEIHSAHGYLLNQFYSPLSNRRKDAYTGATLEGRIRLHLEVIRAVRETVGESFPIALRLGGCDYMLGGTKISDSAEAAKRFEKAGIDLLDISGGFCYYANPNSKEPGYFAEISEAVRENVGIPVILTGGVRHAAQAEALLEAGKADLIGVGRSILKDPGWAAREMGGCEKPPTNQLT